MKRTVTSFKLAIFLASTIFFVFSTNSALADDLLKTIQTDLTALGYDVGPADGELTMKTQLAIGKFEGANNLPVTGEPSFNLAVAISNQADAVRGGKVGGAVTAAVASETQEECLQRVAAAKESRQKRGHALRSLANTGANIAGRFGGSHSLARDVTDVSQTAGEVSSVAQDLGLTPDEAAACNR